MLSPLKKEVNTSSLAEIRALNASTRLDGACLPILRATIDAGDRGEGGVESMKVNDGLVIVRRFDSLLGGSCCPGRVKVEQWRWTDGHLKHVGRDRFVRRTQIPWFRSPP